MQEMILSALAGLGDTLYKNRDVFIKDIKENPAFGEIKLPAPVFKAILSALSERDETADICTDSIGDPEPDSELRDYENVPLKDDINAYIECEVKPYVPDAWIDESKTKIGYEIPFTRHFYVYQELRPLEVIDKEIEDLKREIQRMLREVTG
jgi:type I restriction enzyme M protein